MNIYDSHRYIPSFSQPICNHISMTLVPMYCENKAISIQLLRPKVVDMAKQRYEPSKLSAAVV